MSIVIPTTRRNAEHFVRRFPALFLIPWIIVLATQFAFPGYTPLLVQVMIMIMFALSVDLLIGYAGVVTLGHGALYGIGAYASGLLALNGITDPSANLVCAALVTMAIALPIGAIMLRMEGFTIVMLSLAFNLIVFELVNKAGNWTGGDDGLSGFAFEPVLGVFEFDFFGITSFYYVLGVSIIVFAFLLRLVDSPFGWSLRGIRENAARMRAIGSPVYFRLLAVFCISAFIAGTAGALQAQATQLVGMHSVSIELSLYVVIMLVIGGLGRLYGAFIGVPIYVIAQDRLSALDPTYWYFWMGVLLLFIVLLARGGVIVLYEKAIAQIRKARS